MIADTERTTYISLEYNALIAKIF